MRPTGRRAPDLGPAARSNATVMRIRALSRSDLLWLSFLVLVAFVVRLVWVLYADADPTDGRFNDSVFYHVVAASLAEGGGYTNPFTFLPSAKWAPGYIFLLTPFYWLFGAHHQIAELLNVVLGAATVGALYLLARALLGGPTARLAALLLVFFPGQALFASVLYSETLFAFVFVVALLLAVRSVDGVGRPDWRWVVAFGLAAGVAALVRGVGLWLLIVAPAYWWLRLAGWHATLRWSALAIGSAALLILPWTVRNAITMESPVLISTSAGVNFWQGHHEGASGGNEVPTALLAEHGPLTKPGAEVAMNDAGLRQGLRFALTHPATELSLSLRKVRQLYKDDVIALDLNEDFGKRPFMPETLSDALRATSNAYYFFVLALGVVALAGWPFTRRPGLILPALVVLVWTAGHVAIFGQPRYHFPLMPVFCIPAAWSLLRAFELVPRRALPFRLLQ